MRLFIAIPFPPEIRRTLQTAQQALAACGRGNFTRPENLHLTLAFLGETDRVSGAKLALTQLSVPQLELQLRGLGRFDSLYWAGIDGGAGLLQLQHRLCHLLQAQGFTLETRRFQPHVTLCRQFRITQALDTEQVESVLRGKTFPLAQITLFSSQRVDGKLCYLPIHTVSACRT